MSVSPYELLRSCIPKQPETTVTPYDLYSAVQAQPQAPAPSAPPAPVQEEVPPVPPPRRTHYIAQIRARHDLAQRPSAFPPPRG